MENTIDNFKRLALGPFFQTTAIFCAITVIYLLSPSWMPVAAISLAKQYLFEKTGIISYKFFIGFVLACSGFLGFMITEQKAHSSKKIGLYLYKATIALQRAGGVYIGWGLGLLLYLIIIGKYNEVSIALISLSYLLLITACPIQFAEQMILYRAQNNRLYKDEFNMPRILFVLITLLGVSMLFGVLLLGW